MGLARFMGFTLRNACILCTTAVHFSCQVCSKMLPGTPSPRPIELQQSHSIARAARSSAPWAWEPLASGNGMQMTVRKRRLGQDHGGFPGLAAVGGETCRSGLTRSTIPPQQQQQVRAGEFVRPCPPPRRTEGNRSARCPDLGWRRTDATNPRVGALGHCKRKPGFVCLPRPAGCLSSRRSLRSCPLVLLCMMLCSQAHPSYRVRDAPYRTVHTPTSSQTPAPPHRRVGFLMPGGYLASPRRALRLRNKSGEGARGLLAVSLTCTSAVAPLRSRRRQRSEDILPAYLRDPTQRQ